MPASCNAASPFAKSWTISNFISTESIKKSGFWNDPNEPRWATSKISEGAIEFPPVTCVSQINPRISTTFGWFKIEGWARAFNSVNTAFRRPASVTPNNFSLKLMIGRLRMNLSVDDSGSAPCAFFFHRWWFTRTWDLPESNFHTVKTAPLPTDCVLRVSVRIARSALYSALRIGVALKVQSQSMQECPLMRKDRNLAPKGNSRQQERSSFENYQEWNSSCRSKHCRRMKLSVMKLLRSLRVVWSFVDRNTDPVSWSTLRPWSKANKILILFIQNQI